MVISNKYKKLNVKYLQANKNKIFTISINIKEVYLNNKIIRESFPIINESDRTVLLKWLVHIKLIQIKIVK